MIRGNFVVDSSVAIKWFTEEEHSEIALALREAYSLGEAEIAAPDLILYEVSNALRYNKAFHEEDVRESVDSILKLSIILTSPTQQIIGEALALAFQYNATFYDAYFLALAEAIKFVLITADGEFYEKVKERGTIKLLQDLA